MVAIIKPKNVAAKIISNPVKANLNTVNKTISSIGKNIAQTNINNAETENLNLASDINDISVKDLENISGAEKIRILDGIMAHSITINGVDLNDLKLLEQFDNPENLDLDLLHALENNENIKALDNLSKQDIEVIIKFLEENQLGQDDGIASILKGLQVYNYYRNDSLIANDINEIIGGSIPKGDTTSSYMTPLRRMEVIAFAYSQIGVPYNFDENGGGGWWINDIPYPNPYSNIEGSPNYNPEQASKESALACNGLIRWAYEAAGVDIFQGSGDQMRKSPIITAELIDDELLGTLTPGDIIAFDDSLEPRAGTRTSFPHVAIYIGDGKIIESTIRNGINSVTIANLSDYSRFSYAVSW